MFPRLYGEIEEMIRSELLETPLARAIARKAGIRQGTGSGAPPQVLATFSAANSDEGWEIAYTTSTPFPNAEVQADLTDLSRARLVANVVAGGSADTVLTASGMGEDVSVALDSAAGALLIGAFHPVSVDGITTVSFTITSGTPGSVTLGLVQLQGI